MELKQIVKEAEAAGWTVTRNSKGHLVFKSPDGASLVVGPSTGHAKQSDYRAVRNTVGALRRAGLEV